MEHNFCLIVAEQEAERERETVKAGKVLWREKVKKVENWERRLREMKDDQRYVESGVKEI